jgi:hypothetical protein
MEAQSTSRVKRGVVSWRCICIDDEYQGRGKVFLILKTMSELMVKMAEFKMASAERHT